MNHAALVRLVKEQTVSRFPATEPMIKKTIDVLVRICTTPTLPYAHFSDDSCSKIGG